LTLLLLLGVANWYSKGCYRNASALHNVSRPSTRMPSKMQQKSKNRIYGAKIHAEVQKKKKQHKKTEFNNNSIR